MARLMKTFVLPIEAATWVDSFVARIPVAKRIRGVVLDIILGPAEEFEYVSRTTPRTAPPPPR
jgi:hypothetical protein